MPMSGDLSPLQSQRLTQRETTTPEASQRTTGFITPVRRGEHSIHLATDARLNPVANFGREKHQEETHAERPVEAQPNVSKEQTQYSQPIEATRNLEQTNRLASLDITLREVSDDDIRMVNDRDFQGDYPYIGLLPYKFTKGIRRTGMYVDNQLVGYAIAGAYTREGRTYGEIGMMHISPAVRDLGLGTLLNFASRQQMLELQPEILYSEIGDKEGKIEHLLTTLGYQYKGISQGAGRHPIWEVDISTPEARERYAQTLEQKVGEKIEGLTSLKDSIARKAEEVDMDNPYKVDIEEVVNKRLATTNIVNPQETTTFFGYSGGKVRLARSIENQGLGYYIMLDMRGVDEAKAREVVKTLIPEGQVSINPMYSYRNGMKVIGTKIESNFSYNADYLQNSVKSLSTIAKSLL